MFDERRFIMLFDRLYNRLNNDFEIKNGMLLKYNGNGENVVIPKSVDRIGYNAFRGCSSLKSVTIPDGVESIGEYAFHFCNSLENITISKSVIDIGSYAFYGCSLLKSITVDSNNQSYSSDKGVLFDKHKTELLFYPSSKPDESYDIPHSVKCIERYSFEHCSSLKSITIPNSVTSIGHYAFYGCSQLKSITIPDSVTRVGVGSFGECPNLEMAEIKKLSEKLNNSKIYPKPYGYPELEFEGLKLYYYSKEVDFKNDVRNIVKPDDKSEFKRNDFKLELEITYEKRIFKNKFGKRALALYRSIPTFDSSDREWNSYDELYIMPDGDKLTAFIVGGGHHIGIIYKYTDVLCGNELTENILKSYGIL